MATMIGLMRLGRDAEVKFLADGTAIANLSLVYNYGRKGQDGNRPSQWVDAALFGKQAESLSQYLVKGSMHNFVLNEVRIEEYEGKNGKGFKLSARVQEVELGPRVEGSNHSAPAPTQQRQAPKPAAKHGGGGVGNSGSYDDLDDDIPFVSHDVSHDMQSGLSRRIRRYR